ncbi:MAG: AsmA-like C-terminal domain-containing protein [Sulfurimonas sp.]
MKDTIIINTISKIHSAIVSFLSFILLTLFFGFIVLQNGLYLENFSISNISIKKLYLKWDDKLNLYVEQLAFKPSEESSESELSVKKLKLYSKSFYHTLHLCDSITISKLQLGTLQGELQYRSGQKMKLSLHSKDLNLKAQLAMQKQYAQLHLDRLQMPEIEANGDLYLDLDTLKSFSKLNFSINHDANFTLYTGADTKQLHYKALFHNPIKDIKSILEPIPFPKESRYWIFDAIDAKSLTITSLDGDLAFDNLTEGYKQVHILGSLNKLNYLYNRKLDAIHTAHTDLEFKKGVLYIRPQGATTYNFDLQKSWLKIDFTKRQELLSLFLNFTPAVNKDILYLLNTYKIKLPIKQNSGSVKTKLKLAVNLHTLSVDAQGTFTIEKGNFRYLGEDIDVKNLKLKLKNYDIQVKNMLASYKNIIDAKVDIKYNAKESQGDVKFKITKCRPLKQLQLAKKPLEAVYYIDKEQDILSIDNSSWLYNKLKLNVDKLDIPLDINTLKAELPASYFTLEDVTNGFISGEVDLKSMFADFDLDILNFHYSGIKSTLSNTPFKLQYKDSRLSLKALDNIYLKVVNSDLRISNFNLYLKDDTLHMDNVPVLFGKFTNVDVDGRYNLQTNKAHFSLHNLIVRSPQNSKILYRDDRAVLNTSIDDGVLKIKSNEHRAIFTIDDKKWSLQVNSLKNLYKQSPFIKKYHLNEGTLKVYKKLNDDTTKFQAVINYPYKLLYKDAAPVETYHLEGRITKEQNIYATINKNINVSIEDNVQVNVKDSIVSLPETLKLFSSFEHSDTNETYPNIDLNAVKSSIYLGDNRYAALDTLDLQYHDKILMAQLQHLKGKAGFKLEHDQFHLYGEGFSDKFMEKLFVFSKFKGGTLDFNINGSLERYKGMMLIEKSRLLNYTLLNNVLAFINTVPSLVTFSVPGYSKNGLFMNHAYMEFEYNKGEYNISELSMDSKELKLSARGKANLQEDTIDMKMNLKTDIASNISKIPVVGYIIFDGKAISTSVKVSGKLSDPNVSSALAKEVIVAPLNIIKRTLKLPFKIFE